MKVSLLTQAGNSVGLGHYYRALAAAEILLKDFKVSMLNYVSDSNLDLSQNTGDRISYNQNLRYDILLEQLGKNDFVIYDGKFLDSEGLSKLRKNCHALMVIDDNHIQRLDADIILNHNLHASSLGYDKYSDTLLLLGPQFSLLRPAFLNSKEARQFNERNQKVCISLGGADPDNWSLKIYSYLKERWPELRITILLGKANNHFKILQSMIRQDDKIISNLNDIEMVALYQSTDLLFCSASTTFLEALSQGVPMIAGAFAQDQEKLLEFISSKGIAPSLGSCFKHKSPAWESVIDYFNDIDLRRIFFKELSSYMNLDSGENIRKAIKPFTVST